LKKRGREVEMTGAEALLNLFRKLFCTFGLAVLGFGILVAVAFHKTFVAGSLIACGILLIILGIYITYMPKMPKSGN
jgi:sulfite exporter TauE/SafE